MAPVVTCRMFRWGSFQHLELSTEPIQWINLCRQYKTSKIRPGGCMVGGPQQRRQTADHNDCSCLSVADTARM